MSKLIRAAQALRLQLRERLWCEYPGLRPIQRLPASVDRDAIVVGRDQMGKPLSLSVRARLEHMLVVGTTGGGKTRLIQHCACQDIVQGRGVCVVDPHGNHPGSLYRSLVAWLASQPHLSNRIVHLIDPNAGSHVTGFNPLALPDADYEAPVVAEAMQQALERVWGEEDLNGKPTLQRVLSAVLTALTELKLTLAEARLLLDPDDRHGIRAWAIQALRDEEAREEMEWLHSIAADPRGHQDFRQEVTGPRNRLRKLTKVEAVRLAVSQDAQGIDFRTALDEGHIILANLSPGPRAGDESVQLLGRLLTRSIFYQTVRRQRPDRPFFLYLDECQLYLSGDVSRMLAETRKYGTGVILAHQTLSQLRTAGEDLLDAVKSTTNIKVVTRVKDPAEAAELADMVMSHNVEVPVRALIKPAIVDHRLVRRNSESVSRQSATTTSVADTDGEAFTVSESYTRSVSETASESISRGETITRGVSSGFSRATSEAGAVTTATAVNLVPGNFQALPAAASGNTIAESASTFANVGPATPTRYLLGDARMEPAVVSGLAISQSKQRGRTQTDSFQHGDSLQTGATVGIQQGIARSSAEAWTDGVSYSTSRATTRGTSESCGSGQSNGWTESLEPILADLPTAIHSLQNVRYVAGEVLRNFPSGRVALSFVDATGLKAAVVQVANVADCELTAAEFSHQRQRLFHRSPSAVPIEDARRGLQLRQEALRVKATQWQTAEPDAPQKFRTKRRRTGAEDAVEEHGGPSPPERLPVKGPDRRRRRP